MYQPLNQNYSEYSIENIKKYLKQSAIILKINYYRFKGFWYDSDYKPFSYYNNYQFLDMNNYGIHNSFINFNNIHDFNEIVYHINNIQISKDELLLFFYNELAKFKQIDDNSDINMYEYFINNFNYKKLFHDPFHPTNLFFYEMFRQIILLLHNYELQYEDYDFINLFYDNELTYWSLPILPIVKAHLELNFEEYFCNFDHPYFQYTKLYMNIYEYYYIRLSEYNFQYYLDNL